MCAFEQQACLGISSYGPIMLLFPASLPQALQIFADLNRGYKRRGFILDDPLKFRERPQSKKNIRWLSLLLPIFLDITPRGFLSSKFFCVGLVPCSHFKYFPAACGKQTTHSFKYRTFEQTLFGPIACPSKHTGMLIARLFLP
jgi:hypothetical protein